MYLENCLEFNRVGVSQLLAIIIRFFVFLA